MRVGRVALLGIAISVVLAAATIGARPSRTSARASGQTGSSALRITSITPRGNDVPSGRQIVVQFDRRVVPVGRMERSSEEIPIRIEPALACEWRWLNTSALACQLGEGDAFAPATRYRMVVAPGIETESGETLAEPYEHEFETERPAVSRTRFGTWEAPGSPVIHVTFNQRVAESGVVSHVYFDVSGRRIDATAELANTEVDGAERYWVVRPTDELPGDATVHLSVDAGLVSLEGPLGTSSSSRAVTFYTFPEHAFLGVRCRDNDGEEVRVRPADSDAALPARLCNPLAPVELVFASPVVKEVLQEGLTIDPDLTGGREDYDPWASLYSFSQLGRARRSGEEYRVRIPEALRARTTYHLTASSADLRDEFGRALASEVDFLFTTDDRPPRAVLTHPLSTLERDVETHVPIVVTNLDVLQVSYQSLSVSGRVSGAQRIELPEVQNVAYRYPLRVREWLPGKSGVLLADVRTQPELSNLPYRFFSQVTPFATHVKLGHQNSMVWVTDMTSGVPVSGARVRVFRSLPGQALEEHETLAEGVSGEDGIAMLAGAKEFNPKLETGMWTRMTSTHGGNEPIFFARIEKDDDIALVPLSYDYWVQPSAANDMWIPWNAETRYGHIRTWGTTAQGVYRAGDTIQFKLYVRDQDNERFVPAPKQSYTLRVFDPMDKVAYEKKNLSLNAFGALDGEFVVPETAAVGWYRFELAADFHEGAWQPLTVLVADFTPAPFRVTTDLNGESFEPGDELRVHTSAKLHAGGPYADSDTRVTVNVTGTHVQSHNRKAQGFWFGGSSTPTQTMHQHEDAVDSTGQLESTFTITDPGFVRGRLLVESAVRDDRGKYVAGRATASFLGRDRFVGVKQTDWLLQEDQESRFLAIVLDGDDAIASGVDITMTVQYRETTASRVKGAGNAFLTEYNHEWVDVTACEVVSSSDPVECPFTPEDPGRYRMQAAIRDTKGRVHTVNVHRWARGKGRVLWEAPPGHSLQIEAEKPDYKVGETARFLVQNPFPGTRALITVERLGIQSRWLETFAESTAVIEVEVTEAHVPGFYLSAVVTSPRVGETLGDGDIDLGKPAFRLGYVQVPVRDPVKEIVVDVTPERDMAKPRDTMRVTLAAKPRLVASSSPPPMEFAVAVLDEAVFDLIGRGESYFDPHEGFYDLDPLDVQNFNLLTRLIGIQEFEKKGANAGGGGGGGPDLRSVFKFVSYWNPSVIPDGEGKAAIEFEVPDNLTGWRVLALAVTKDDQMGLGQGTFVVNKPTEIRPALPNQVIEGDTFEARFTVMNRTEEVRILTVEASVSGPAESIGLSTMTLEAEPYRRYPLSFPVRAVSDGKVTFTVRAGDLADADLVALPLEIRKRMALEVAATFGSTMDPNTVESFHFPENMRTDVGEVSLVASPSVLGNLEGAFRYLRDYPYLCWEQKLTKAVMASHFSQLSHYTEDDFDWPGHEHIPDQTIALAQNHQAPNGGMVYWVPRDEYASPYLSAYTALAFHWLGERGHSIPTTVESKLHEYLRRFLRRDVFADFYSRGMASTVRAVALAALAVTGNLEPSELERYRSHVEDMDLFGKSHFLMAANALEVDATAVRDSILAHSSQSSGKFVLAEEIDAGYQRILYSPERTQCAALSALSRESNGAPSGSGIGDIPSRLARTVAASRGRRDRWENTQENVFCMNALIDYSRVYESETPSYELQTFFDEEPMGTAAFRDLRDDPVTHVRPIRESDPGSQAELRIAKLGPGRLYYSARLSYSPREPRRESINSGMEVRREYSVYRNGTWTLLREPMQVDTGELVRVDIFASLPTARNFVVIDDPVPGGLEPVNRDLATASTVDADQGEFQAADGSFWFTKDDWFWYGYSRWSFYHRELRHDSARFFSEYLPGGHYHLSYVAQAISEGEFQVPPVHAEEMYDPDVFGQGIPGTLIVTGGQ